MKEIAKLIVKISIYPSKEESRGAAESYLKSNHAEFFHKFTETRWTSYYNAHMCRPVSSFFSIFNKFSNN